MSNEKAYEVVDGSEVEQVASFPEKYDLGKGPLTDVLFCGYQTVPKEKSGEDKDFQVAIFKSILDEKRYSLPCYAMLKDELDRNQDLCGTIYQSIEITDEIPAARKGLNPTKVFTFKKATLKNPVDPKWLMA